MSNKTRTVEVPEDAIAIEAHGALALIANLLHSAPADLKPWLEHEVTAAVQRIVPRMMALTVAGPYVPVREMESLADTFAGAAGEAEQHSKQAAAELTPSIIQAATAIAAAADTAIKTRMITAENEQYVNHDAWLDVVEGHAIMTRGIVGLNDVPSDYADDRTTSKAH